MHGASPSGRALLAQRERLKMEEEFERERFTRERAIQTANVKLKAMSQFLSNPQNQGNPDYQNIEQAYYALGPDLGLDPQTMRAMATPQQQSAPTGKIIQLTDGTQTISINQDDPKVQGLLANNWWLVQEKPDRSIKPSRKRVNAQLDDGSIVPAIENELGQLLDPGTMKPMPKAIIAPTSSGLSESEFLSFTKANDKINASREYLASQGYTPDSVIPSGVSIANPELAKAQMLARQQYKIPPQWRKELKLAKEALQNYPDSMDVIRDTLEQRGIPGYLLDEVTAGLPAEIPESPTSGAISR
jgi:hypothetical protein